MISIYEKEILNSKTKKEETIEDLKKKKLQLQIQEIERKEKLRREREEAITKQEAYNTIITSLRYILLIVCAPFVLLFAFVFGMLKSV